MKKNRSRKIENSGPDPGTELHIECAVKPKVQDDGIAQFTFQGYSGQPVNLAAYGFDHPVVYNIATMKTKQKQPIKFEHSESIGHTTSVRKVDNNSAVRGKGLASLPGATTEKVVQGIKNGFPFEASMGLIGNYDDISFYTKGTVTVNNRELKAPIYVWDNTEHREMTVTESGRDHDTHFNVLNKEDLMKIKNSAKPDKGEDSKATQTPPENKEGETQEVTNSNSTENKETEGKDKTKEKVENSSVPTPSDPVHVDNGFNADVIRALRLTAKYPDKQEDILNGLQQGWDDQRIEDSIELSVLNSRLPTPPKGGQREVSINNSEIFARTCLAFGNSPEYLEEKAKIDPKIVENAHNKSMISITEVLLSVANAQGGNFTGHSDVEDMCEYIKNAGYSTFDLPDFFKKVGTTLKEERWTINPPFSTSVCKEGSNKDFRINERKRLSGGGMWNEVADDGKLDLYSTGDQKTYQTKLQTYGNIFTMTRQEVINDDQGALNDLMDMMIEGSMMIPDYQLGRKMLTQAAAANTFWVNNENSFTSKALTRANLSSQYKAIRKYYETKDEMNWQVMLSDRWTLIVGPDLEEEAWEILKQDKIVGDTTANTKTGDKNYWFGRLDLKVFPQMGNTSAFGTGTFVSQGTWILWPSSVRFAPYEITYLRNAKKPTIRSVTLPDTLLGFGTKGYWDVRINERERTAIARHNG